MMPQNLPAVCTIAHLLGTLGPSPPEVDANRPDILVGSGA
jgi:hypothetical protein